MLYFIITLQFYEVINMENTKTVHVSVSIHDKLRKAKYDKNKTIQDIVNEMLMNQFKEVDKNDGS